MHKGNLPVNCNIKKIKAFFFTFKDDKDKGEHRDKVEENKTLSEGTIWQTQFIKCHG